MTVMLSPHLSLEEFTVTNQRGLDNTMPDELMPEAKRTAELFERVRTILGSKPVIVSSGYRSPAVNRAVGSGPSSDHPKAMAFDFVCPGFGTAYEVARQLEAHVADLGIGQLIYEQTWVHVSSRPQAKPVNRVLTTKDYKTFTPGIVR